MLNILALLLLFSPFQKEIPTVDSADSKYFSISLSEIESLRISPEEDKQLQVEIPHEGEVTLTLQSSCFVPDEITYSTQKRNEGKVLTEIHTYNPSIVSYDIRGAGLGGSVVVFKDHLIGSIRYKGQLYELKQIGETPSDYVLFNINKAKAQLDFNCAHDKFSENITSSLTAAAQSTGPDCIEVGIEIDYYTYNTFSDCDATIDWVLAIMAGVDEVYRYNLDDAVTLSASYINIWQSPGPYAQYTWNANGLIAELKSQWENDPILANAPQDLIHLFTKRLNTGAGGLAYSPASACAEYSVAYSAGMEDFTPTAVPAYTWNQYVVSHEMGHVFGAHHTHWCGWPGGPIDNCANIEGSCSGYTNNPTPSVGTLMSYCNQNGSLTLDFHQIVLDNAILQGITNSAPCIGDCVTTSVSCGSYCEEDLDGDGMVSISDLLVLLTEINCSANCATDLDGSGTVDINDMLVLLAAYGTIC